MSDASTKTSSDLVESGLGYMAEGEVLLNPFVGFMLSRICDVQSLIIVEKFYSTCFHILMVKCLIHTVMNRVAT